MIDYHLHLWEHPRKATEITLETLSKYCERAQSFGITQIAITEHFHRFVQSRSWLGDFWNRFDDINLYSSMKSYFDHHATYDLEDYIEVATQAKELGLPIVVGLEMDYYKEEMSQLNEKLSQYPFDVILGSVHWIKNWRFDDLDDPLSFNNWDSKNLESVWDEYALHMEELSESKTCDVLAHPDLIKVANKIPKDAGLIREFNSRIVDSAKKYDLAAEVSSAGFRKPVNEQYPSLDLLELFVKNNIPITTASDAHRLEDIGSRFEDIKLLINSLNIKQLAIFHKRQRSIIQVNQ